MTLLGRADALRQLRKALAQRHHTLVVGPIGIGKSALLCAALRGRKRVLRLSRLWPLKPALLNLAQQLHAQGRLELPEVDSAYLAWEELKPKLIGCAPDELLQRLILPMRGQLLVVDELDGLRPPVARLLEPVFETTLILGAITTVDLHPDLQRFFWHFRMILLEPLPRKAARTLLWTQVARADVPDVAAFERHVLDEASGNPLAIRELARQAHRESPRTPEQIRRLHHEAGIHYVDLTPGLLLIGAGAVVLRFLALGLNDIEAYILAGSFGACFLAARYFIYRAMRRSA